MIFGAGSSRRKADSYCGDAEGRIIVGLSTAVRPSGGSGFASVGETFTDAAMLGADLCPVVSFRITVKLWTPTESVRW